jgi:hypothetical protein
MAGLPVAGAVMDMIGVHGLPLTLGLLCLGLGVVAVLRRKDRASRPS